MNPFPIRLAYSRYRPTMKPFLVFVGIVAGLLSLAPSPVCALEKNVKMIEPSPEFLAYWKSGLAEIASYEIREERYGEMRNAQGILVFVYEETNADTRIKVESEKTLPAKRIPVLKLNNVLKFNTGIYDYSIMTSVFAGLSGEGVKRPFQPQKIAFSSQEWCGNVYHQLIPKDKGLVSEIHSYFESEGDAIVTLPYPTGAIYYEDELPLLLRELDGEFLPPGEPLNIQLVPSLWERRKRHDPLGFKQAIITKIGEESFLLHGIPLKTVNALKWTLDIGGAITTYHVENTAPRKLLGWENSKGEKGILLKSVRKSYWNHHENKDQVMRKELQLNYGVGG